MLWLLLLMLPFLLLRGCAYLWRVCAAHKAVDHVDGAIDILKLNKSLVGLRLC